MTENPKQETRKESQSPFRDTLAKAINRLLFSTLWCRSTKGLYSSQVRCSYNKRPREPQQVLVSCHKDILLPKYCRLGDCSKVREKMGFIGIIPTVKTDWCIPSVGGGVFSDPPAEEASRHPGENVMSSRQMSPFGFRPTLPSNMTWKSQMSLSGTSPICQ